MRRREFIVLAAGTTAVWPLTSTAHAAGRIYRLGVLAPFPREEPASRPFFDELPRHGFIEGKNLTIDYRFFGPHVDLISQDATELVKGRADVIWGAGGAAIRAAQQATKTAPIFGMADDMVGEGLVDSLARPMGNTTGLSIFAGELDGKRQEILIEAVPRIRRIAALADVNSTPIAKLDLLREAAHARNIELSIYRVAEGKEIADTIDTAKASGASALNILASPMFFGNRRLIIDRAAALRLPAIYQWPDTAEEGGFVAYGPRFAKLFELLAQQAAKLLRGTKVADIPVEQPTKFELAINLKTAKALGVTIPEAFLQRADKVIE
jgi:putative tryptophan/tyrosine transport system substrate-binding protein